MKSKYMPAFLLPTSDSYHKYFSDEVCDSLELIEADYGLKGFAVVIKLWQKIYGSNEGYYCVWNDKVGSLFAKKIGAGKGLVFEIVNCMIKEGIFDEDLFEKHGILTSGWIQQNWLDYMKRRADAKIENDYLLVKCAQTSENECKNAKNASKKEKIAYKNTTTEPDLTEQNLTELYSTEDGALLSAEQRAELVGLASSSSVEKYITKIENWQKSSDKTLKDPYATIKAWIAEDKKHKALPGENHGKKSYDLDEFEEYALNFGLEGNTS